ncbi:uncharacterized protein LOC128884304 [Hylaeus volcanicus]|uniref:uncharacterized protein LOC128884304 n=1 Tax=Hylaeus volcanicus TaxID=313075 RepID=UPI0023B81913|nr:uncharacterized protein LOC128884304 [Hylaeus volcanicus]
MNNKSRTFDEELHFIEKINEIKYRIRKGFVPNMKTDGIVYVNSNLKQLLIDELEHYSLQNAQQIFKPYNRNKEITESIGGFLPALKQIANVASLPGIVGNSIGLPDVHSGYGFAIGNMAAFDTGDPQSIISPGGVGFDINCGVRLLRTNLTEQDILPIKEKLAQSMFDHIPVGVGSQGIFPCSNYDLDEILLLGMDWSLREGFSWPEDKEHCEEYGRLTSANPVAVSSRAKRRGLLQLGTLGAGNHYAEVQIVDEIYDEIAAKQMGLFQKGQVCVMIHTGSRGLGHQVATDSLLSLQTQSSGVQVNDKQLACARINSPEGQKYLKGMAAAANYAWVNRSVITFLARQAFAKVCNSTPDDLDMCVIYDVSHNVAKFEQHCINGKPKELLIHRKGSTRAFPPHHPLIPLDYQFIGQPVLIGGTMGTNSYIALGTVQGMSETFGSTCHGAGRALSRNKSRNTLDYKDVLQKLHDKGISVRVASSKLIMEEASEAYKDVSEVVNTCHAAGISKKCVKLRPIAVIKG